MRRGEEGKIKQNFTKKWHRGAWQLPPRNVSMEIPVIFTSNNRIYII